MPKLAVGRIRNSGDSRRQPQFTIDAFARYADKADRRHGHLEVHAAAGCRSARGTVRFGGIGRRGNSIFRRRSLCSDRPIGNVKASIPPARGLPHGAASKLNDIEPIARKGGTQLEREIVEERALVDGDDHLPLHLL